MGRVEKLFARRLVKESKAICRTRKVGSAEELLRVELLHLGEGLSLKETSTVAKEGGISDISSAALYHRARKSVEWLKWMCKGILEHLKPLRICALRKSKGQAERAKRKTMRQINKESSQKAH